VVRQTRQGLPSLARKNPTSQPPDKISKIPFITFLTLNLEVCIQNFSSLALKPREEAKQENSP